MAATNYPDRLEGGSNDGALYLGIEEDAPVYWNYSTDQLVKPQGSPNEPPYLEDVHSLADMGEWVGEYITNNSTEGLWTRSSPLGDFLASVAEHESAPGMLGPQQAVIYALRTIAGLEVRTIARALDSGESTIYNTHNTAETKLDAYRDVLGAIPKA